MWVHVTGVKGLLQMLRDLFEVFIEWSSSTSGSKSTLLSRYESSYIFILLYYFDLL
jgi:hypothetical protein